MSQRIRQEFYCSGCCGFFLANINLALDARVLMICPECGRKHQRQIKKGRIEDCNKFADEETLEEIVVTKAAYSKTAFTDRMKEAEAQGIKKRKGLNTVERNGVPLDVERWLELTARQQGEIE